MTARVEAPVASIGGPQTVLRDHEIDAFIREQLDGADLAGRSVCVLVPDAKRSCPLPLLLSAVHAALHGRVSRLTVVVALGTHGAMGEPALAAHLGYSPGGAQAHYPQASIVEHEWWEPSTFAEVGVLTADRIAE